ncbi:hypothetical protein [Nocardia sp. NPDC051832]|uniref:DUF7373 family lipoprotein n=1 Tax=Nocardia sp. NPDC051832 TaxID=3155673 RepID=UPI003415F1FA
MIAVAVAGCGTIPGKPEPQRIHPEDFDVAPYSVEPLEVPANDNERYGRVVESARMIEALVDPAQVDPALIEPVNPTHLAPLPTPVKAAAVLANPVGAVLERHGMLAGAMVARADKENGRTTRVGELRALSVIVLRFPDTATAEQAARDIDSADFAVSSDNVAAPIPNHPAAQSHWRPGVPSLAASLAHESYVISLLIAHTAPDLPAMTELAGKTFTAQTNRLRDFPQTPRAQLAGLPLDQHGMVRLLVPPAPSRWSYPTVTGLDVDSNAGWESPLMVTGVVYGPHGAGLSSSSRRSTEFLAINGLERLARYRDTEAAGAAFTANKQRDIEIDLQSIEVPAELGAGVWCAEDPGSKGLALDRYSCRIQHGRYFATVFARTEKGILRRAAIQVGLLANGG